MRDRPLVLPKRPYFSCGPTVKPPGWSTAALEQRAILHRNHRADIIRQQIRDLLRRTHHLAGLPDDHVLILMPGSCTGAFEAALWSLLGPRPVDALSFDAFGRIWAQDAVTRLNIPGSRTLCAPDGQIPDLAAINPAHDVVTVWNATPTGVILPQGPWCARSRDSLLIADVTSAVFMVDLPWDHIDVGVFSGQKALGGEGQLGFISLSPRAVARLNGGPYRALPKILSLCPFDARMADGWAINTPSLLALADWDLCLSWAEHIGGLPALCARVRANHAAVAAAVDDNDALQFAVAAAVRSPTVATLSLAQCDRAALQRICEVLADAGAGYDLLGHRDAPPAVRIWCGPTVETRDISALMPWIIWAAQQVRP